MPASQEQKRKVLYEGKNKSNVNLLLTEHEGCTKEYWPKVIAVYAVRSFTKG